MHPAINALFGNFRDAYTILGQGTTVLDKGDTALVLTEEGNLQLFIPGDGEISEQGLALVEIYNAMCRDKAGVVDKQGRHVPSNEPYQGFTQPFIKVMLGRVG